MKRLSIIFIFILNVLFFNRCLSLEYGTQIVLNQEVEFKRTRGASQVSEGIHYTKSYNIDRSEEDVLLVLLRDSYKSTTLWPQEDDGNVQVEDTSLYPNRCFCQLSLRFPDGIHRGSGVLVGPQHVLTHVENVYDAQTKSFVDKITARFGLNGKSIPFGKIEGVRFFLDERGMPSTDIFALIVLSIPIGKALGWFGLMSLPLEYLPGQQKLFVTGYSGAQQYNALLSYHNYIRNVKDKYIIYQESLPSDLSKCPLWINTERGPAVIALHNYEGISNRSTKMVPLQLERLITWISLTNKFREPTPYLEDMITSGCGKYNGPASLSPADREEKDVQNQDIEREQKEKDSAHVYILLRNFLKTYPEIGYGLILFCCYSLWQGELPSFLIIGTYTFAGSTSYIIRQKYCAERPPHVS